MFDQNEPFIMECVLRGKGLVALRQFFLLVLVVLISGWSLGANVMTLNVGGGQLVIAPGVDVNGTL
jgi:hypothetical protein